MTRIAALIAVTSLVVSSTACTMTPGVRGGTVAGGAGLVGMGVMMGKANQGDLGLPEDGGVLLLSTTMMVVGLGLMIAGVTASSPEAPAAAPQLVLAPVGASPAPAPAPAAAGAGKMTVPGVVLDDLPTRPVSDDALARALEVRQRVGLGDCAGAHTALAQLMVLDGEYGAEVAVSVSARCDAAAAATAATP